MHITAKTVLKYLINFAIIKNIKILFLLELYIILHKYAKFQILQNIKAHILYVTPCLGLAEYIP